MSSRSAFGREKNNTMPGTSRTQQKAEAKYNVTTEFPRYDLHFAAASGNLGLVEFALSHGQPINSVLNGVLPLHAACAGGCEVVVKYLIDEGADVNAPRLPRKYSNEKHRSSGLAVGASGSTPLHFAAANGHLAVVRLLLAHGAVPDRADKHGVTPEMLARENGWIECAETLAAWSGGREGDLPPLKPGEVISSRPAPGFISGNLEKERDGCELADFVHGGARKLHMKRSIDNALHLFKAPRQLHHHGSHGQLYAPPSPSSAAHPHSLFHSHFHHSHSSSQAGSPSQSHLLSLFHHAHSHSSSQLPSNIGGPPITLNTSGPNTGAPPSPRPLGEYTFYTTPSPTNTSPIDGLPAYRRPSLPQVFDEPESPFQRRVSGRRRRPRSAGSDAEQTASGQIDASAGGNAVRIGNGVGLIGACSVSSTVAPRKLGSKISLRNLFRRSNVGDASASGSEPGSGSASASTSYSASPAPIHHYAHAMSAPKSSASLTPPASPLAASFTPPMPETQLQTQVRSPGTWYRMRLGSDGAAAAPRSPLVPSAVELHHRYSQEQLRGPEPELESELEAPPAGSQLSTRPSILRGHNRSVSSQSSGGAAASAGPRMLRFDASSASPSPGSTAVSANNVMSIAQRRPSPERASSLRGSRSTSSLRHGESFRDADADEDEDDYGTSMLESTPVEMMEFDSGTHTRPVEGDAPDANHGASGPGPGSAPLRFEYAAGAGGGRARGASFASTASSSSPGVSPDNGDVVYASAEFPFSIERPPLTPVSATSASTETTHDMLLDDIPMPLSVHGSRIGAESLKVTGSALDVEDETELRTRGDSFSSMETDHSVQSSDASAQTSITTPSPGTFPKPASVLAGVPEVTKSSDVYSLDSPASSLEEVCSAPDTSPQPLPGRAPLDLRGISNLAEAEALVRRAQQAIHVSAELPADGPDSPGVPLATQLAAYGEILALERRFARGEKQRELWAQRSDDEDESGEVRTPQSAKEARLGTSTAAQRRRDASARVPGASPSRHTQRSPRHAQGVAKTPRYRRPHTAEGAPKSEWTIVPSSSGAPPAEKAESVPQPRTKHVHGSSTTCSLQLDKDEKRLADIEIFETIATPMDSPKTPESVERISRAGDTAGASCTTTSNTNPTRRPSLPLRSRTPEPEMPPSADGFSGGVPLTRVATAPLQDTGVSNGSYGGGSALRSDPATRRAGGAHKLARMGFSIDTRHHRARERHQYAEDGGAGGTARSPSKTRFGGIKSFVQSLKGKS